MKLIKINTDHYIIVDDSEIKEGDWLYSFDNGLIVQANKGSADTINSKSLNGKGYGKITHSTQALGIGWQQEVIELSLQEVKELIGEVDVAEISYLKKLESSNQDKNWIGYGKGIDGVSKEKWKRIYNQAIEDNKEKKYTENQAKQIWKAGQEYWKTSGASITFEELTERMIKQPKTEWDVEFDSQGKLKNKNMKMEELLEMYKNLDMKERIKFDREYNKFKEEEKLEQLTKRKELVEELNNVINDEGQPYFSSDWVKKNILNSKQK